MKMKEALLDALGINKYGGLSPFLRSIGESSKARLGRYDSLKSVDWNLARRLVFVCKGNICRSPYAEAKARSLGFTAISCGLQAAAGSRADLTAQQCALQRGVDITGHRSKSLSELPLLPSDIIVLFDPAHMASVRGMSSEETAITILGIWSKTPRPLIFDPYGKSIDCYEHCFNCIDSCLGEFLPRHPVNHNANKTQYISR